MRWLLAGGMRSFLAGYVACPVLIGLVFAIVVVIHDRSVEEPLMIVPGMMLVCFLAPLGLIVGMVCGIWPEGWGPWDGRLVYMGLMAGLVALVIAGRWLEKRNSVPDGGDGTLHVPAACVVTARRAYRLPMVAWNQLTGPALLVIAGVGLFFVGCVGWAVLGALD